MEGPAILMTVLTLSGVASGLVAGRIRAKKHRRPISKLDWAIYWPNALVLFATSMLLAKSPIPWLAAAPIVTFIAMADVGARCLYKLPDKEIRARYRYEIGYWFVLSSRLGLTLRWANMEPVSRYLSAEPLLVLSDFGDKNGTLLFAPNVNLDSVQETAADHGYATQPLDVLPKPGIFRTNPATKELLRSWGWANPDKKPPRWMR